MRFLGNKPPPIGHKAMLAATAGLREIHEGSLQVPGVRPNHVTEWLVRCWTWSGRSPERVFRRSAVA